MDLMRHLGLGRSAIEREHELKQLHVYINLKLATSGQPGCLDQASEDFMETAHDLVMAFREKNRMLSAFNYRSPADQRIQHFLDQYLGDLDLPQIPQMPFDSFILDRHGVAREMSLPMGAHEFHSDIISSYRVRQGVLNNPASDRRTTAGSFHIAEGGLPIPGDKKAVPKLAFARLLEAALRPPEDLLTLPFTANQPSPARMFVSLLLRPLVCPAMPDGTPEKSMEVRFFAPGNLVSNLDFVESIFGNAGNPNLAECDAGLDVAHWTGTSGCVILAPHLTRLSKRQLGLPHKERATPRQIQDGMYWEDEAELYNGGNAFKLTARDEQGVIVTLVADNYYGYCKKEVKTQIGYSANLMGLAEEEHAGGALAFRRRSHGEEYGVDSKTREPGYSFDDMLSRCGELMDLQPDGHGIDKIFPDLVYVPQNLRMDLNAQTITWLREGRQHRIRLEPGKIYMQPNGYKIEMVKHPSAPTWNLVGTDPEGVLCHKPCTVSGGGKSEISKSLNDAVIYGPLFVDDLEKDLARVQEIFDQDYTHRYLPGNENEDQDPARPPLSAARSLGSVIKLLTPSPAHTPEYRAWLESIPPRIQALAFLIKRFYRPEWGDNWRRHVSVDEIDGAPGHELKLNDRRIMGSYLRIGFDRAGKWRTFKVRQDFCSAEKIQMEDDITASVVVPNRTLPRGEGDKRVLHSGMSSKLVKNCEYRLFQRPDDAVIPGFDKQTEQDLAQPDNFLANYEPLGGEALARVAEDVLTLHRFTPPMRELIQAAYREGEGFVVSSAHPRLVDGKPSKNPRYLQTRPDLIQPVRRYAAETGIRFHHKLPLDQPLYHRVDAVLTGRRNNPPEPGIRPLAVYNPIHYQELPELFMDFICSLTGKSPSTTGAGSEGALTKGPFNALRPTADLNAALVSYVLTGYAGFSSSAGYIGANVKIAHDISLLVPEIWARLDPHEREPHFLINNGYLDKLDDFDFKGEPVLASRLGYRINSHFVHAFLGKIFDNPSAVLTPEILQPETQDMAVFADGVRNITEAHQRVAMRYLEDGSVEEACPPLQALLHIMAEGQYQGMGLHDPEIRKLFSRDYLLGSDWYRERLETKQRRDIRLWSCHVRSLEEFLESPAHGDEARRLQIDERLTLAKARLEQVRDAAYLEDLQGTLGADPLGAGLPKESGL